MEPKKQRRLDFSRRRGGKGGEGRQEKQQQDFVHALHHQLGIAAHRHRHRPLAQQKVVGKPHRGRPLKKHSSCSFSPPFLININHSK